MFQKAMTLGNSAKCPLVVKYIAHEDAGHYEAVVPDRVSAISPLPKLEGNKRKTPTSSKSQILASIPYKNKLEQKKKKKRKTRDEETHNQNANYTRAVRLATRHPAAVVKRRNTTLIVARKTTHSALFAVNVLRQAEPGGKGLLVFAAINGHI